MSMPKEMGGAGNGANPEQLFGAGYSTCVSLSIHDSWLSSALKSFPVIWKQFIGAMGLAAKGLKTPIDPANIQIDAEVDLGKPSASEQPLALAVRLMIKDISPTPMPKENLEKIAQEAHKVDQLASFPLCCT